MASPRSWESEASPLRPNPTL